MDTSHPTPPADLSGDWTFNPQTRDIVDYEGLPIARLDDEPWEAFAVQNHGRLIESAPDLLALAKSFRSSCSGRIAVLREELTGDAETDADIEDQIGHWQYSLDQCNHVIDHADEQRL